MLKIYKLVKTKSLVVLLKKDLKSILMHIRSFITRLLRMKMQCISFILQMKISRCLFVILDGNRSRNFRKLLIRLKATLITSRALFVKVNCLMMTDSLLLVDLLR